MAAARCQTRLAADSALYKVAEVWDLSTDGGKASQVGFKANPGFTRGHGDATHTGRRLPYHALVAEPLSLPGSKILASCKYISGVQSTNNLYLNYYITSITSIKHSGRYTHHTAGNTIIILCIPHTGAYIRLRTAEPYGKIGSPGVSYRTTAVPRCPRQTGEGGTTPPPLGPEHARMYRYGGAGPPRWTRATV